MAENKSPSESNFLTQSFKSGSISAKNRSETFMSTCYSSLILLIKIPVSRIRLIGELGGLLSKKPRHSMPAVSADGSTVSRVLDGIRGACPPLLCRLQKSDFAMFPARHLRIARIGPSQQAGIPGVPLPPDHTRKTWRAILAVHPRCR